MAPTLHDYEVRLGSFCAAFTEFAPPAEKDLLAFRGPDKITERPRHELRTSIAEALQMSHEDLGAQLVRTNHICKTQSKWLAVQRVEGAALQQSHDKLVVVIVSQLIAALLPRNDLFARASALTRETLEARDAEAVRAANWFIAGLATFLALARQALCLCSEAHTRVRRDGARIWWATEDGGRLPLFFSSSTRIEPVYAAATQLHAEMVALLRGLRLLPTGMSFDFEEFGSLAVLANLLHNRYPRRTALKSQD